MSSKGHDFILEVVQIKIKQMGYRLIASDSHYRNIKFSIPPTILNHRPDVLGYNSNNNSICIGEAKYYGDLDSKRSITQIKDFIDISNDEKREIKIVFGVPLSEEEHFSKILKKNDLKLNKKIMLIKVPDRLIPKKEENEKI